MLFKTVSEVVRCIFTISTIFFLWAIADFQVQGLWFWEEVDFSFLFVGGEWSDLPQILHLVV